VGHKEEGTCILNLKICGSNMMVLWNKYNIGGRHEFHGLPSYVLANKLKALKVDLKKWNAEVFGDVGKKKKQFLEGIRELDCIDEDKGLVEEERVRKTDMIRELEKTLLF